MNQSKKQEWQHDYVLRQFEITKMYVSLWQAKITSGWYKTRKIYITENGVERLMTEEELLDDAMDTMGSHISRANELSDQIVDILK